MAFPKDFAVYSPVLRYQVSDWWADHRSVCHFIIMIKVSLRQSFWICLECGFLGCLFRFQHIPLRIKSNLSFLVEANMDFLVQWYLPPPPPIIRIYHRVHPCSMSSHSCVCRPWPAGEPPTNEVGVILATLGYREHYR